MTVQPSIKRIAIFLPSLAGGGAERAMLNLAGGFAERGFLVDMVLVTATGPYLSQVPRAVRVVDLKCSRVLASLPSLIRYLWRAKPTFLISSLCHANLIAVLARQLARSSARVICTEQINIKEMQAFSSSLREWCLPILMKIFYPIADGIVAISSGAADQLVATLGIKRSRIAVIYNPVVSDQIRQQAEKPIDHPWFDGGAPPVVLGVGRLTKQKDFVTLIKAFALVRKKCPVRLMILGEGEERNQLEALIQQLSIADDSDLPGFVANPYQYMRRASVFVLSSRFEGLAAVLIEAMACGTHVISTDCPSGPAEILENGRWGALVPTGDVNELAEAILRALQKVIDPDVAARAAFFSVDNATEGYLQLLSTLQVDR